MRRNQKHQARKPVAPTTTLADRLLATGQRLRADETIAPLTFQLNYAAKWTQGGAR